MVFVPIFVLVCLTVWVWLYVKSKRSDSKYPPGPYPLPIIGNILQVGRSPHISLANLSKKYGALMYLKLGAVNTIVVSSPEMAKLILQKHDQVFSGRMVPLGSHVYDYHKHSVGFLPTEDKWRRLRKICNEHIFSVNRLDASQDLRQEKLKGLRDYVRRCCDEGRVIDIGEAAFMMTLSLMSATLCSYDFGGFDSESARQVRGKVQRALHILGTPNVADFFPFLKVFDPQGIMLKAKKSYGELIEFLEEIVDQRFASRSKSNTSAVKNDFLEELLNLSQESDSEMSFKQIRFLLLDMLLAGTSLNAIAVEWAMTELLRNPDKMSKVRCELNTIIGGREKLEESDIPKLSYLNAVVKETLRLHPPGPFLAPHEAAVDFKINDYIIPKKAQILINVWATGRDPRVWSSPNSFEPERFLESEINYRGQYFELIPFGSGRRTCPGLPLAHRMMHLNLASLIHGFDWKLQGGMKPEEIDLSERFGLTLEKSTPLTVVPVKLY